MVYHQSVKFKMKTLHRHGIIGPNFMFYQELKEKKIGIRRGQLKIERFHAKVPLKSRYKIVLLLQV